jgi:hypothetical protein
MDTEDLGNSKILNLPFKPAGLLMGSGARSAGPDLDRGGVFRPGAGRIVPWHITQPVGAPGSIG